MILVGKIVSNEFHLTTDTNTGEEKKSQSLQIDLAEDKTAGAAFYGLPDSGKTFNLGQKVTIEIH